jgi:hypothetical protein
MDGASGNCSPIPVNPNFSPLSDNEKRQTRARRTGTTIHRNMSSLWIKTFQSKRRRSFNPSKKNVKPIFLGMYKKIYDSP